MMEDALYRQANDRIHAPEALKQRTLQMMKEEAQTHVRREPHPVYVQQVAGASGETKVIPMKQHIIRTALISAAAAAMFFLAGRYLMPSMRAVPVREDVANVITETESIDLALADKGANTSMPAGGYTLMQIDMSLEEIAAEFDTETVTIGEETVLLRRSDNAPDAPYEAYFTRGGVTWVLLAEDDNRNALIETLTTFLQ